MVFKKKKTAEATPEKIESETEAAPLAESVRVPMMTQVVEVVDDGQEQQQDQPTEELMPALKQEPVSSIAEGPETEEIRKELVDDLFKSGDIATIPEISIHHKKTSRAWHLWAIMVIVCAVVTGAGLFFARGSFKMPTNINVSPTPTSAPTVMPSPTSIPPKKETVTIEVLNGGGKVGAASKMKAVLEKAGYKVGNTGNTEDFSHETTEVHVKAGQEGLLEMIKSDLKADYTVSIVDTALAASSAYDAQVVVGKQ